MLAEHHGGFEIGFMGVKTIATMEKEAMGGE
jgi:hypothetical protein